MGNSVGSRGRILTLTSHTSNGRNPGHQKPITALAISDDKSLIVSASDDCTIRLWPAQITPTEDLGILKGHKNYISCLAIVRSFVLSGSHDNTIRKWDIETCECVQIYSGHTSRITGIVVPYPEKEHFFSVSYDNVKVWEMDHEYHKKLCVGTIKDRARITAPIIFITTNKGKKILNSDMVVTAAADRTAKSFYVKECIKSKTFSGHKGAISVMMTDDDHSMLFTGSFDRTIRCFDIHTSHCLHVMEGHRGIITCLQLGMDNKRNLFVYSGSSDGTARCWEANYGVCNKVFKGHTHTVHDMQLYGGIMFTACGDGVFRAFESDTASLIAQGTDHTAAISKIIVERTKVFTASHDSSIRVWDIKKLVTEFMSEERRQSLIRKEEEMMIMQNENLRDLDEQLDEYYQSDDSDDYSRPGSVSSTRRRRRSRDSVTPDRSPSRRNSVGSDY